MQVEPREFGEEGAEVVDAVDEDVRVIGDVAGAGVGYDGGCDVCGEGGVGDEALGELDVGGLGERGGVGWDAGVGDRGDGVPLALGVFEDCGTQKAGRRGWVVGGMDRSASRAKCKAWFDQSSKGIRYMCEGLECTSAGCVLEDCTEEERGGCRGWACTACVTGVSQIEPGETACCMFSLFLVNMKLGSRVTLLP